MQHTTGVLSSFRKLASHKLTRVFLLLIPVIVLMGAALAVPWVTGRSVNQRSPQDRFTPPLSRTKSGSLSLLGTDQLGRSLFLEIIYGGKISLYVSFASVIMAMIIGTVAGIFAGYYGGFVDMFIMRLAEIQLCFPSTLLAIVLSVFVRNSLVGVIIILTAVRWAQFARVARGETLHLQHREFVEAARSLGGKSGYIIFRHIVPHLFSTLLVLATSMLGRQMLIEASLSFLGIGVTRPFVSWGGIISSGRNYLSQAWWVSTLPGVAMLITVISISLFGDALRDYLDPRTVSTENSG